jgi:glycosyltransferase involved in cell wall biosynthesis
MTRSLGHGGTERQVSQLAISMDRSLFHPHVACFDPGGFREAELLRAGVPILQMNMHSFVSRDSFRAISALRSYTRAHDIRLVHTFDHPMNVFGIPAARLLRIETVLSSQRSHRQLIPPKYLPAIRVSDRLANGVVVNCDFVRKHLITDYAVPDRKIHICYNAIDTTQFAPGPRRRPQELSGARLVIGAISVLRAIKGLPTLLAAFARIAHKHTGLRLLIVGSGPERAALERQAGELGIAGACLFRDSTSDVPSWLRAIDIFVLPSLSEALSNSLMEAMSTGCCAIASRVGGNPELIRHGETGLLFEARSPESLAAQLQLVTGNDTCRERLADTGAAYIRTHFSTERSVGRMQEIYLSYLRAPGSR